MISNFLPQITRISQIIAGYIILDSKYIFEKGIIKKRASCDMFRINPFLIDIDRLMSSDKKLFS
ncbi:hypothetical protein QF023_003100 [Chryseobacterium sp. SLBN-27]|nr:hypothetical protein [Chryseobacterium sp. SLBN-27]